MSHIMAVSEVLVELKVFTSQQADNSISLRMIGALARGQWPPGGQDNQRGRLGPG